MIIRKPKKSEFQDYAKLEQEFYNHHKKYKTLLQDIDPKKRNLKKEFNELLKENCFFRFAIINKEIVGYIYGIIKKVGENEKGWKKIGDLNSIHVKKGHRRSNIAKKLTQEYIKWLKSKKVRYLESSCNTKNKGTIKFHTKLGFKEQQVKFGKFMKP